jgi:hypothetical protein
MGERTEHTQNTDHGSNDHGSNDHGSYDHGSNDHGGNDTPTSNDCTDQASLISADVQASVLGVDVCANLDVGGGLDLGLGDLGVPDLPDCLPDLGIV